MRLIDADIAIKRVKTKAVFYSGETADDFDTGRKIGLLDAVEVIADEAAKRAIDTKSVKCGYWQRWRNLYRCSECKFTILQFHFFEKCDFDFCPHCGARMDGDNYENLRPPRTEK